MVVFAIAALFVFAILGVAMYRGWYMSTEKWTPEQRFALYRDVQLLMEHKWFDSKKWEDLPTIKYHSPDSPEYRQAAEMKTAAMYHPESDTIHMFARRGIATLAHELTHFSQTGVRELTRTASYTGSADAKERAKLHAQDELEREAIYVECVIGLLYGFGFTVEQLLRLTKPGRSTIKVYDSWSVDKLVRHEKPEWAPELAEFGAQLDAAIAEAVKGIRITV